MSNIRITKILTIMLIILGFAVAFERNGLSQTTSGPLKVSTANPRYFRDSIGKTVYLSGSHTWASMQDILNPNGPFDFTTWLSFLQQHGHNFMRAWAQETATVYDSDAGAYASPLFYARPGPGNALDGNLKFDVTQFDQTYFDRLRSRVAAARDSGIYVSVMFFNGWSVNHFDSSQPSPWIGHPFNRNNNINGINGDPNGNGQGEETQDLSVSGITTLQEAYVRKVIDTVNDLDNVLYEISNESGPGSTAWQTHFISYIKSYEAGKPYQHPVGMTGQLPNGSNPVLFGSQADWISPNNSDNPYGSDPPAATGSKVILLDTDHFGSVTPPWVWKSFTRGYNPILMDWDNPPLLVSSPWYSAATEETLRKYMGYTVHYAQQLDLAKVFPHGELASTGYALANPGYQYLVYQPSGGAFTVNLAGIANTFAVEWFNPATGSAVAGVSVSGGSNKSFTPPFSGEAVLYLTAALPPPPGTTDTAPPSQPTGVVATTVSSSQLNVMWLAATDNVGVTGYRFDLATDLAFTTMVVGYADRDVGNVLAFSPPGLSPSTTYYARVRAYDAAGNVSLSSTLSSATTAAVAPTDTQPPTVAITSPSAGAYVRSTITVKASASDNVKVTNVQFQVDGVNIGVPDTSSPYSISWNTTQASNGSHTLTAIASDAANNRTTSAGITVMVDNATPPAPTGFQGTALSSSQINLTWNPSVDNSGSPVRYRLDRCRGLNCTSFSNIAATSNTYYLDTGRNANTTYRYRLSAIDAAGNSSSSVVIQVTTLR